MTETIADLEAYPLRLPYDRPIRDARSVITHKATVLVRIESSRGNVGWGEAAAFGDVAHAVASIITTVLKDHVVGFEATARTLVARLRRTTAHYGQRGLVTSAISGIELAVWDLMATRLGVPLCVLLGASPRPVRLYAATGYYDHVSTFPQASLELLRRDLELLRGSRHFCGAKIKLGRHGIADDVQRVQMAREILGPEALVIGDANNSYTLRDAIALAHEVASSRPLFLEEPIEFGQPDVALELRRASPIPIAGFELESTFEGFRPYITRRALDIVQPDCIWSGGLLECIDIGSAAAREGIDLVAHNFASPISTAANYHLTCVTGGSLLEIDCTDSPLAELMLEVDGRDVDNGNLLMEGAGLGVKPNLEHLTELLRTKATST